MAESNFKATLEWEGKKVQFEGTVIDVWNSITKFFSEVNPQTASIAKLIVSVNLDDLLMQLNGVVQIDKDVGIIISPDFKSKLSDTEKIVLVLLIQRLSQMLNYSNKDTLDVDEVQRETRAKSVGVLLSQLIPQKIIQNVADPGKKGSYRITDYGMQWFFSKKLCTPKGVNP